MSRALLLTTSLPRHPADIAGRFVAEQASTLAALGLHVRVLAPHDDHAPPGVQVVSFGGRTRAWPEALEATPLRTLAQGARFSRRLGRVVRRVARPDEVVVGHWLLPCGWFADICWAHGGDVALLERLPRGVSRELDARLSTIAFVSDDLRARFQRLLGRPARADLVVAPMGVAPPQPDLDAARRFRNRAAGRPIVATVGRDAPIKGLDVLARALHGLDVCWLGAGSNLGVLAPPERDALLSVADVFVQPSRRVGNRSEGAPVAVMEAVTAGVPVVATRTGGIADIALGARLVPPEDPVALRAAIQAALDGPRPAPTTRFLWQTQGPEHARLVRRARRPRP